MLKLFATSVLIAQGLKGRLISNGSIEMIDHAIKFQNSMVMVFDEKGKQIPEYEGRYEEVRDKILADAHQSARFFRAVWMVSGDAIPREEW
jgi:hypothetical protein